MPFLSSSKRSLKGLKGNRHTVPVLERSTWSFYELTSLKLKTILHCPDQVVHVTPLEKCELKPEPSCIDVEKVSPDLVEKKSCQNVEEEKCAQVLLPLREKEDADIIKLCRPPQPPPGPVLTEDEQQEEEDEVEEQAQGTIKKEKYPDLIFHYFKALKSVDPRILFSLQKGRRQYVYLKALNLQNAWVGLVCFD